METPFIISVPTYGGIHWSATCLHDHSYADCRCHVWLVVLPRLWYLSIMADPRLQAVITMMMQVRYMICWCGRVIWILVCQDLWLFIGKDGLWGGWVWRMCRSLSREKSSTRYYRWALEGMIHSVSWSSSAFCMSADQVRTKGVVIVTTYRRWIHGFQSSRALKKRALFHFKYRKCMRETQETSRRKEKLPSSSSFLLHVGTKPTD